MRDATPRDFSIFGAPFVMHEAMELYGRSHLADRLPPPANVVISNVPGPQTPLYVAGAKVLTLYPVSIPAHGMAVNLTVQSYCGSLDYGLTACRKTVPDLRKLAGYLDESLQELLDSVFPDAARKASAPVRVAAAGKRAPASKRAPARSAPSAAATKSAARKSAPRATKTTGKTARA